MPTHQDQATENTNSGAPSAPFLLDGIRIDPAALSITRNGEGLRVEAKVMQVLLTLAHAQGEVVSRADIEKMVWPGRIVTDDTVTNAVVKLRKALQDNSRRPRLVETIAKRGYRLMVQPEIEAATPVAEHRTAATPWRSTGPRIVLLLLTTLLAVLLLWPWDQTRNATTPIAPSIVVMPLDSLGTDNPQTYFAEGITLDLITELSRVPNLLVLSPVTAFEYRQSSIDDLTAGAETGVSYLVHGGVQRSGDQLRINIRLVETEKGSTLWAERFEGKLDQIFKIQDQAVSGIAVALRKQLGQPFIKPKRNTVTRSVAAYDAFLRGQERYARLTPTDNREAQAHFEDAIELDPTFARAYASQALTWSRQAIDGWTETPDDALTKAYELANKALALDPNIPQVHFVVSQVQLFRGQHEQAAAAASAAIELNPNYADAYALLAWILHYSGRPAQALDVLQDALKRNPNSSASYHQLTGELHFATERYRKAVKEFQATLERNPAHMRARLWLALSHVKLGQEEEAAWEVQEALSIHSELSLSRLQRAFPLKDPRQFDKLTQALHQLGLPYNK